MGFYAVISNPNGNAGIIVITCHSPAELISSAGASIADLKRQTNSPNSRCNSADVRRRSGTALLSRPALYAQRKTLESLRSFNFKRRTCQKEKSAWRRTRGLWNFLFFCSSLPFFLAFFWPDCDAIQHSVVLCVCVFHCVQSWLCVIQSPPGIHWIWSSIKYPADRQSCQSAAAIHQCKCSVFILFPRKKKKPPFQSFVSSEDFDLAASFKITPSETMRSAGNLNSLVRHMATQALFFCFYPNINMRLHFYMYFNLACWLVRDRKHEAMVRETQPAGASPHVHGSTSQVSISCLTDVPSARIWLAHLKHEKI